MRSIDTMMAEGVSRPALDPRAFSLKRAAWAYGCAKKGSREEAALMDLLLEKARMVLAIPEEF